MEGRMSELKRSVPVHHTEERRVVACDAEGCDREAILNYVGEPAGAQGWWRIYRVGGDEGTWDVKVDACSAECFEAVVALAVQEGEATPA